MKTFNQHCNESFTADPKAFTNNPRYKFLIDTFIGPIFRFKLKPETLTQEGVTLTRQYPCSSNKWNKLLAVEMDVKEMTIDVPKIEIGNEPLQASDYDTTNILFASKIKKLNPSIINSATLKIPWSFESNFFDFVMSGRASETMLRSEDEDMLKELITIWGERFAIYNTYCDTPGSEADKTLAVAEHVGVTRLDILNLKRRFGILKHEEIGDEDVIGML